MYKASILCSNVSEFLFKLLASLEDEEIVGRQLTSYLLSKFPSFLWYKDGQVCHGRTAMYVVESMRLLLYDC